MDSRAHRKSELSKKRWNAALAREVLADFAASGMSLTGFARSMGENLQRLYWWRKRLESTAAAPKIAFVPATITRQHPRLLVRLPGGIEIETMDPAAMPPPSGWLSRRDRWQADRDPVATRGARIFHDGRDQPAEVFRGLVERGSHGAGAI